MKSLIFLLFSKRSVGKYLMLPLPFYYSYVLLKHFRLVFFLLLWSDGKTGCLPTRHEAPRPAPPSIASWKRRRKMVWIPWFIWLIFLKSCQTWILKIRMPWMIYCLGQALYLQNVELNHKLLRSPFCLQGGDCFPLTFHRSICACDLAYLLRFFQDGSELVSLLRCSVVILTPKSKLSSCLR